MSFCQSPIHHMRIVVDISLPVTIKKERCVHVGLGEQIEDVLCVDVGAIVKG